MYRSTSMYFELQVAVFTRRRAEPMANKYRSYYLSNDHRAHFTSKYLWTSLTPAYRRKVICI